MRAAFLSTIVILAALSLPGDARGTDDAGTIGFTLEEVSGNRPIVQVRLGDLPYRMMIHANAGFYMQINHATAGKAGARLKSHVGSYGIERSGQVSRLGRDEGTLPTLAIGRRVWRDAPVSVFETPADGTGMLGLRWITENRIIVDFPGRRIAVSPAADASDRNDERLRRAGYRALPMRHDPRTGKYLVDVSIGFATRPMVVSMVAGLIIDRAFAQAAGLPVGAVAGELGGPTGAVENSYAFGAPVALTIGGWRAPPVDDGTIEDIYAYSKAGRPADPQAAEGGALGADFLIAHRAVVDFGRSILYLR